MREAEQTQKVGVRLYCVVCRLHKKRQLPRSAPIEPMLHCADGCSGYRQEPTAGITLAR